MHFQACRLWNKFFFQYRLRIEYLLVYTLKCLIYKTCKTRPREDLGGMAPRPMIPTTVICWTKCVNMVCTVTPAVIPPSAAYIYRVFAGFY